MSRVLGLAAFALSVLAAAQPVRAGPPPRPSGLLAGPVASLLLGLPFQGDAQARYTTFGFQLGLRLGGMGWNGPLRDAPSGAGGAVVFDGQFASGTALLTPTARAEIYLENPLKLLLPSVHGYVSFGTPLGRIGGESVTGIRFGLGAGINAFVAGQDPGGKPRSSNPRTEDQLWRVLLLAFGLARAELQYERLFLETGTVQTFRLMLGLGL